jgi:hypothetical protein
MRFTAWKEARVPFKVKKLYTVNSEPHIELVESNVTLKSKKTTIQKGI